MKHPNQDEWAPYLFGEARPDDERRLRAHLQSCPECAAEVEGWQRSLKTLDAWEMPPMPRHRNIIAPVFRWAVAAAIVLAAGLALGRMTAPSAATIRAEVERSVKTELAGELERALAQVEARMASVAEEGMRELSSALEARLENARGEDRRATGALVQAYQREMEGRYVALRRDLETVASLADQEIRQARFTMTQLAAKGE